MCAKNGVMILVICCTVIGKMKETTQTRASTRRCREQFYTKEIRPTLCQQKRLKRITKAINLLSHEIYIWLPMETQDLKCRARQEIITSNQCHMCRIGLFHRKFNAQCA